MKLVFLYVFKIAFTASTFETNITNMSSVGAQGFFLEGWVIKETKKNTYFGTKMYLCPYSNIIDIFILCAPS